ncbi:hypothetical protein [Microcystis sp. LE19-8.1F]|nr:hypothetical protein [Microcystis sp. LE19-8.1F]MCZ8211369.1 hypothetical protein [Microcystis sp. LE19-8.1F]
MQKRSGFSRLLSLKTGTEQGRRVWGVGCGVWGVGCRVSGVGCRVWGVG